MQAETMWRLLLEFPRLWAVRSEWYPPGVELEVHYIDGQILLSRLSDWKDGHWWAMVSYNGAPLEPDSRGGQRVYRLCDDPGITLLEAMNRTGGHLNRERREFVVIDRADQVQASFLGRRYPAHVRRITIFRPPQGYESFNHLLSM